MIKYTVRGGRVLVCFVISAKRPTSRLFSREAAWVIIPGTGYETSSGGPFFR